MEAPRETNVIQFTKNMDESHLLNAEDSILQAKLTKMEYCDEVVEFTLEQIFSTLNQFGIYGNPNKFNTKDVVALSEVLEALAYRYYNIEHPFHELIDQAVSIEENDEEENFADS